MYNIYMLYTYNDRSTLGGETSTTNRSQQYIYNMGLFSSLFGSGHHFDTHTMFTKYTERYTIYCQSRRLVHSPDTRCQFIALYSNDVHRWLYRRGGEFSFFFFAPSLSLQLLLLLFLSLFGKKIP